LSDVFDEIISKLKQKAKNSEEISESFQSKDFVDLIDTPPELWVRLEDVKEAIQQIKQNYVLVPKEQICKPIEHIEQYFKRQDEFLKRTLKKKETSEKGEGES